MDVAWAGSWVQVVGVGVHWLAACTELRGEL